MDGKMDVDFHADSLSVDEEEQSSGPPLKKKKTAGRWRGAAIYIVGKKNGRFCLLLKKILTLAIVLSVINVFHVDIRASEI